MARPVVRMTPARVFDLRDAAGADRVLLGHTHHAIGDGAQYPAENKGDSRNYQQVGQLGADELLGVIGPFIENAAHETALGEPTRANGYQ